MSSSGPIVSADMRFGVHRVLAPLALLALGAAGGASAQTGVTNSSPFLPANGAAAGVTAPSTGGFEFIAVVGTGAKTTVGLYDPATKKSRWIPVGDQIDGVAVLTYDARRERIVVRTGGAEKALTLRTERGVQNGTISAVPPVVGLATPAQTPLAESVVPPLSGAPAIAATPANPGGPAAAATPGAKPPRVPVSAALAKQQEDARLLVSDLLEIGQEQRQAYEAAQKQAAQQAQTPKQAPTGTPAR